MIPLTLHVAMTCLFAPQFVNRSSEVGYIGFAAPHPGKILPGRSASYRDSKQATRGCLPGGVPRKPRVRNIRRPSWMAEVTVVGR